MRQFAEFLKTQGESPEDYLINRTDGEGEEELGEYPFGSLEWWVAAYESDVV